MAIKKQATALKTYLEDVLDGKIIADPNTQRSFGSMSNLSQDGLIMTTMDSVFGYIPPLFLTTEGNGDTSELWINDGLHRTYALKFFYLNIHKISKKLKNSIVTYDVVKRNENGEVEYDDEGHRIVEKMEFDMAGKCYKDLPKELQKRFDCFNIDLVIFENCDTKTSSHLLQIYNEQSAMNSQQKAITYIPNFARKIKELVKDSYFFKNCGDYKANDITKNKVEYAVIASTMTTFFPEDWRRNGVENSSFLNENATEEQFAAIKSYLERLSAITEDKYKNYFNMKNTHLFVATFAKFTEYGLDDERFADFLDALENGLDEKSVELNGEMTSLALIDAKGATTNKSIVLAKIAVLEILMKEFFGLDGDSNREDMSDSEFVYNVCKDDVNITQERVDEDMEFISELYEDMMLNYVPDDTALASEVNHKPLLGLIGYTYYKDIDIEQWLPEFAKLHKSNIVNPARNYDYMLNSLMNWNTVHTAA